ncbi:MAG: DUF2905 domain-containing protein [Candidatus Omnitrophota bacterium]
MAKLLIIFGILLTAAGLIIYFAPWLLTWFGRLPGDIRIENDRVKVFIPIVSMLIISIIMTVIVNLFRR